MKIKLPFAQTSLGDIPANWRVVPLSDYAFFQEGPGLRKWQWTTSGMKVINVTNILQDGNVDVTNTDRYISLDEFSASYSHFAINEGDIVVASSGNTYGKIGRIRREHLPLMMNTSVVRLRSQSIDELNDDYLYSFLRSYYFRDQVEQFVTGSAQPNFGPTHLKQMEIVMPPLPTQRRIAAVLSAYDDLIENNTRRIAILEEMARSLYREWFVHFRFPGHENVEIVERDGVRVPSGWESKGIGEVIQILGGGTPSTNEPSYWADGNITWFSPTELTSAGTMFVFDSTKKITQRGLDKSSARLFPAESVMMTSRATIGVVAINTKIACTNQGFITCLPNEELSNYHIYFWLLENRPKIESLASGATFREINKATFRQIPIVVPPQGVEQRFNGTITPICQQIQNLITKNTNLRHTRDLLLPRLVSGELDVSELAIV